MNRSGRSQVQVAVFFLFSRFHQALRAVPAVGFVQEGTSSWFATRTAVCVCSTHAEKSDGH